VFIPTARIDHGRRRFQSYWDNADLHLSHVARVYSFLLGELSYFSRPPYCPHSFHQLLTILLAGFVQAMYALDAADGMADNMSSVSSSVNAPLDSN
jgi:hypothetical protein